MNLVFYLLVSYLVGAIPTALILGRLIWKTDIRRHGSGNPGATNAWRVLGWRAGLPVLFLDLGKGAFAAGAIPRLPLGNVTVDAGTLAVLCGLAAVLGHVFPVYLRFRGGKGVATAAGMLVLVAPVPVGIATAVFGLALLTSGIVSLGSVLGAWTLPLCVLTLPQGIQADRSGALIGLSFALAAFITWTHRSNLRRIVRRDERVFRSLQIWRPRRRDHEGHNR